MKRIITALCIAAALSGAGRSYSAEKLRIITAYPWIADITGRLAGNRADVSSLASGDFDPHTIIPRPSYIAKLRNADLLIINGAQLEIGWLPPIIRRAANPGINPGMEGFLDLSRHVTLIDKPAGVSRADGDVHPDGNPHYCLDPENIPPVARAITNRLRSIDPAGSAGYEENLRAFLSEWKTKSDEWKGKLASHRGVKVVEYHKIFDYFILRFGLDLRGTIEPLPGIPPFSGHIVRVKDTIVREKVSIIFMDVYNPQKAAKFLASETGARYIIVPHDVGAVAGAKDIVTLFDEIVRRLSK